MSAKQLPESLPLQLNSQKPLFFHQGQINLNVKGQRSLNLLCLLHYHEVSENRHQGIFLPNVSIAKICFHSPTSFLTIITRRKSIGFLKSFSYLKTNLLGKGWLGSMSMLFLLWSMNSAWLSPFISVKFSYSILWAPAGEMLSLHIFYLLASK